MCKVAPDVKTIIGLFVATSIVAAIANLVPREPMHHGWDWPWHDWRHSPAGSVVDSSNTVGQ